LLDPVIRRRLGQFLVGFTILTALVVTLYPFRFSAEVASLSRVDWRVYYPLHNDRDLVLNLLMLVPLGVGLGLLRAGISIRRLALEAAAIGFGLSLAIETLQIFERARFPQLADVWRNGLGCVVGAVAIGLLARFRRAVPAQS
jgi:glycopeptide antibiotics resistance protein